MRQMALWLPFTRLDRYVVREMLIPLGIGTLAILLMLIGNLLFNYAPLFFSYGVPVVAVAQFVIYYTPYLMVLSLPVGTAVGTALTVNRLARDAEITVLRIAGISLRRIFMPLLLVGLLLSGANYWLNEHVVPPAMREFNKLRNRVFLMAPVPNLASNAVVKAQNYTITVGLAEQRGDKVLLEEVLAIERRARDSWLVIKSPKGSYQDGIWEFEKPMVLYVEGDRVIEVQQSPRLVINLQVALQDFFVTPEPEEQTRAQLREQIARNREMGYVNPRLEVSYHLKVAMPMACFVLALCSPVLSFWLARAGSFVGVLLSIVLVFVFWNTFLLFRLLGDQGLLPPLLSAWLPNLLFGAGGFYLIYRAE